PSCWIRETDAGAGPRASRLSVPTLTGVRVLGARTVEYFSNAQLATAVTLNTIPKFQRGSAREIEVLVNQHISGNAGRRDKGEHQIAAVARPRDDRGKRDHARYDRYCGRAVRALSARQQRVAAGVNYFGG